MIMNTNTNNIIKVNIHVLNRFTNKHEIVKVSVRANSVMELCERLAGVNGRNLHYLLARPELFNQTRYFFSCFTKEFKITFIMKRKWAHAIDSNMMESVLMNKLYFKYY